VLELCRAGGELAEFYDSAEVEGVKDGSSKLHGWYYYITRLTY